MSEQASEQPQPGDTQPAEGEGAQASEPGESPAEKKQKQYAEDLERLAKEHE
jgi:hypothetical protein